MLKIRQKLAMCHLVRSDSRVLVGQWLFSVENHYNTNGELFIWTSSGHLKSGENGSGAHLLEDPSIFETCALGDCASHNFA